MSSNFPGALDNGTTLPNPSTTSYEDTLSHAAQHGNANDAVKAVQTKLGTGASAPSSGLILLGTGTGASAWSQLTSAQLFALLADKTGSGGSAVFNTSPTLITPKVDTITEATLNNGVTIAGVNVKSGAITTSNAVATTALADSSVTPAKLQAGTGTSWVAQAWTPTIGGFSANPTGGVYTYIQVGKLVTLMIAMPNNGTSNATTITLSLPVNASTRTNMMWSNFGQIVNNGTVAATPGLIYITSATPTIVTIYADAAGSAFVASGNKRLVVGSVTYEAA